MVKNSFSFKIICVVCILLILAGHNLIVYVHEKDAQIDQMQAEIEMLLSGDSGGAGASSGEAASDGASGSAGAYKDGTYSGSADGYGGTVTMEVVVENGSITEINPTAHSGEDAAYWDMAVAVIPQLVESQGAQADTVSGATFSSTGILNAVTQALNSAL